MKPLMLADCHCHSLHSFDGRDSIAQMLRSASDKGAIALTITDHFETGCYNTPEQCDIERIKASAADVHGLRAQSAASPLLLRGIELGQPLSDLTQAMSALTAVEYDLVLGSVHIFTNGEDLYYYDFSVTDPVATYNRYLDELLTTLDWGHFDALAHLTYPRRYMLRDNALPDLSLFAKKTDEILALATEKGIAIEINTNAKTGHNTLLDEYYEIMRRYRQLGGKLVTLGSDAHSADDVLNGFSAAREILLSAGFETACYFVNRTPVEYSII